MKRYIAFAASTALLAAAVPALSADFSYDPPIFVEQMPDYVPVEVGTGWYLRGDITYNLNRPTYRFSVLGTETENNRFGGGLGIGYQFTDLLRMDVTVNYAGHDRFSLDPLQARHELWTGMATAYVDLGTVAGITPYVGAGVGLAHSRNSLNLPPVLDLGFNETRFAYTLNAGAAYRISENTSVDIGYQYLSSPTLRRYDVVTGEERRGIAHHQIRAGVRYELW